MSAGSKLEERLVSTAHQLAQKTARHLLREHRQQLRARTAARLSAKRRKLALGSAVAQAGLDEWETDEIVGLLLDGKARIGASTTQRLGMKKLGQMQSSGGISSQAAPL